MSTVRRCDVRCHNAKRPDCDCWCGGLFHGDAGKGAREAFAREFGGEVPAYPLSQETLQLFPESGQRWRAGIEAAHRAARQ